MADNGMFSSDINQFYRKQNGTGTATGNDGFNDYDARVVQDLVEQRGRADVAKALYPTMYETLYSAGSDPIEDRTGIQQPSSSVVGYNRATQKSMQFNIGEEYAKNYNPDAWDGSNARYDIKAQEASVSADDEKWADKVLNKVDYSQLGGINGSTNKDAYKLFDNGALLTNLFVRRLGMRPEEVLALNPYDRREISEKLLRDYYNASGSDIKTQIGDADKWVDNILHSYGFDKDSQYKTSFGQGTWDLIKGVGRGAKDQLDNYATAVETFITGKEATDKDVQELKAERLAREQDQSQASKASMQRFQSLIDDDRWEDAALWVARSPEMWGDLMGSTVGGLLMDMLVTEGLIVAGTAGATALTGGLGTPATVGAGVAASAANMTRIGAKLADIVKKARSVGGLKRGLTFAGTTGMGMTGAEANDILLDGNNIPKGSDAYNLLLAYGILGTAISFVPGTVETQLVKEIMKRNAAKGMTEDVAIGVSKKMIDALKRAGFKIADDGAYTAPSKLMGALKWGGNTSKNMATESATEFVQEGMGSALRQAVNEDGTVDFDKVDLDQVKKDAGTGAILGGLISGGTNVGLTALNAGKARRQRNRELEMAEFNKWYRQTHGEMNQVEIAEWIRTHDLTTGELLTDDELNARHDELSKMTDEERNAFRQQGIRAWETDLWMKFKRRHDEESLDPSRPIDDPTDADTDADPADDTTDTDQDGTIDVEVDPVQEAIKARARQQTQLRNEASSAGVTLPTDMSVTKDIGYDTAGKDWKAVENAAKRLSTAWNTRIGQLSKAETDKKSDVFKYLNAQQNGSWDTLPDHLKQTLEDAYRQYEVEISELRTRKAQLDAQLARVNTTSDIEALINDYGTEIVDNAKGSAPLQTAMYNLQAAIENPSANTAPVAGRWNAGEFAELQARVRAIAEKHGLDDVIDFGSTLNDTRFGIVNLHSLLAGQPYANTIAMQHDLQALHNYAFAIKHDVPEIVTQPIDKLNADIQSRLSKSKQHNKLSDLYRGNEHTYNRAVNNIKQMLGWSTVKNHGNATESVFTEPAKQAIQDIIDSGKLRVNPEQAIKDITAIMDTDTAGITPNPNDKVTKAQFGIYNRAKMDLTDMLTNLQKHGTVPTTSNPKRDGQVSESRFIDGTWAKLGYTEAMNIVKNLNALAKANGFEIKEAELSEAPLAALQQVKSNIENSPFKVKGGAANNTAMGILAETGDVNVEQAKNDALDYVTAIEERLTGTRSDEVADLTSDTLLGALVEQQRNMAGTPLNDFLAGKTKAEESADGVTTAPAKQKSEVTMPPEPNEPQGSGKKVKVGDEFKKSTTEQTEVADSVKIIGDLLKIMNGKGEPRYSVLPGSIVFDFDLGLDIMNAAETHVTNGDVEEMAAFIKAGLSQLKNTNGQDFSHETLNQVAFAIQRAVGLRRSKILENASTTDKARAVKDVFGAMNNELLVQALRGDVTVGDLHDFFAKTSNAYAGNGKEAFARLFNPENGKGLEDVRVRLVPQSEMQGAMGRYDPVTNTITLVETDGDIARTLAHEYIHAFIANRAWGDNYKSVLIGDLKPFSHGETLRDTLRKVLLGKQSGWLNGDSDMKARLLPGSEYVIKDINGNDTLSDLAVEELVVRMVTEPTNADIQALTQRLAINQDDFVSRVVKRMVMGNKADNASQVGHEFGPNGQSPNRRGYPAKYRKADKATNQFRKDNNLPEDGVTVYHFGFNEDNTVVSSNPHAWYENGMWNFFYFDQDGNPVREAYTDVGDLFTRAQDLDLFIETREKDVMLKNEAKIMSDFDRFTPGVARFYRGLNRLMLGDEQNINPLVRGMMDLVQRYAVNQMGIDQFFGFFENTLTAMTGTNHEGVMQSRINRIRSKINHQLTNYGVDGDKTIYQLRREMEEFMREIGWSKDKIDNTLYAMRAAIVQPRIMDRQVNDPKWKDREFRPSNHNLTGFTWGKDANGNPIDDPDGSKWMASLTDADKKIADHLKTLLTNLNDNIIRLEYESGRITEQQYLDNIGEFYVPLRNETDEATAFQRMAVGRHTKADSPLTHFIANYNARIRAAEQSMIYQAFFDLMQQHPVKGFATFNSSSLVNKGDGEYGMQADGFMNGTSVTFYKDGRKVNMTITDPVLAKALTKRKNQATSAYLNTLTKVTAYLGLVRTGTPTFAKTAFLRDAAVQFFNNQAAFRGRSGLSDAEHLALGYATARDMVKFAPMMVDARRKGMKDADWRYRLYRSEGGIGNSGMYDMETTRAFLERDVFGADKLSSKAKRAGETYLDVLHVTDDAARFSLWYNYLIKRHGGEFATEADMVAYLRRNPDIADIARDASKNITGNFEQRGMDRAFRSHFIFWNAIQAGVRTFAGMINPRYGTYGLKSLAALAAFVWMSGSDEEDEDGKLKDSRMKGLGNNLWIGDYQIPLAQELRPFVHLVNAIKYVSRGDWTVGQGMKHFSDGMVQAIGLFTPAETDDFLTNGIYAVTPTVAQPVILLMAGRTYFGGDLNTPVYDTEGKQWKDAPDAFRATQNTAEWADESARFLYNVTGGGIDVNPNSMEMWAQQLLGGVYSLAKKTSQQMAKGENVLGAFGLQMYNPHVKEYNVFALGEEVKDRFAKAEKDWRIDENDNILGKGDAPDEAQFLMQLKTQMDNELKAVAGTDGESKMSDLIQRMKTMRMNGEMTPDQYLRLTTELETIRGQRNAIYGKYNRILMDMGY